MIYTSYYANYRKWSKEWLKPYQISNTKPKWFDLNTDKISQLIPPWNLVDGYKSGKITEQQFTNEYLKQLETVTLDFKKFSDEEDSVLLCWEKADQFCHRHILRKYLNRKGIPCKEFT